MSEFELWFSLSFKIMTANDNFQMALHPITLNGLQINHWPRVKIKQLKRFQPAIFQRALVCTAENSPVPPHSGGCAAHVPLPSNFL